LEKSRYYDAFAKAGEHNLFSEPNLAAHAKIRRPLAQLYSQTTLLSYEPFVDTCNAILIKKLDEYAQNGKTLDVRELLQFYAFDMIGEITVGSRFGLMEYGGDTFGIVEAIDGSLVYGAVVGLVPEWHWWISKIAETLGVEPDIMKISHFVQHHIDDHVSGRTEKSDDRSDFLDKLLYLEQEDKAKRVHTHIAALQNIAAGSDTTAISLTVVLAHLAIYPDTLATLRRELDEATASGALSDPATFQQAQKLPYLQACIMEAMRVHPAVGAPMTRVVGSQGLRVRGTFFPAGTEVGINPWVIHNNKSIFGPDAHVFRPERWLTVNKEERRVLESNFLAFGNGPRTCLGKNISMMEMSKVVPQIVRKYDLDIVPDEQGRKYTWKTRWFAKPELKAVIRRKMQKAE
jgi:cytochrome P450